jgi:polyhydroxybutyrate depolymerase
MESMTQLDPVADAHGFVVAYPNSVDAGTIAGKWQIGCCTAQLRGTGDLHFLSNLINDLVATEHIDRTRVYVVGFSLGAAMTYRVACEMSSQVAGIASVSGFEYLSKPCNPTQHVSVYELHGTTDYYGGSCGGQTQTDVGCGFGDPGYEPSVQQTNMQWRRIDGCNSVVHTIQSGSVTRKLWPQCKAGSEVQLDVIQGGRHCYPQLGSSCGNYNATADIWRFLSRARLSSLSRSRH